MKLVLPFAHMTLARRYLWGALIAALIPLGLIAALYDRYSANLLENLITNRVDANLESTAAALNNFMAVQINRLENIADLPDTTRFFDTDEGPNVSALLSDILQLEVENPDIYAIELSDINGSILHTIPKAQTRNQPANLTSVPQIQHGRVEVVGPIMPMHGRPGWFLITMPVFLSQEKVGYVSLRMRLSSLTEQVGTLFEPNVFEPQIVVFDRVRITPVGTQASEKDTLAMSRQFFPGWRIHLVEGAIAYREPKTIIRYLLLVAAILSALGLIYLFQTMSARLTSFLQPLSEGARAIANGNFNVPVSEDAPGELGLLARAHNRMRLQLGKLIDTRVDVERRAALGKMAAGIAHEIRNPLTTVSTTVHGLKRHERDPERKEMFDVISSEIERVDKTIGEFLNYAKPSEPNQETVVVRDVLRSIRTLVSAAARDRNIVINLSGQSNLAITIDEQHFRQILLNLALNAIEAMPNGGHLSMKSWREDGAACLMVSDDGEGFDAEMHDKVLRPFFTTKSEGTGLGLPMTKQLVEANGGSFLVESMPGEGTNVLMSFPLHIPNGEAVD